MSATVKALMCTVKTRQLKTCIRFNTVESTGLESHQSVFPVVRNHAEVVDCTTQYLYLLVIQVEGTISCFQWHPSVHRATMQYLQS